MSASECVLTRGDFWAVDVDFLSAAMDARGGAQRPGQGRDESRPDGRGGAAGSTAQIMRRQLHGA
jgi:hypothetical protein